MRGSLLGNGIAPWFCSEVSRTSVSEGHNSINSLFGTWKNRNSKMDRTKS